MTVQIQNNLKPENIPFEKSLNISRKVEFHYPEGNLWTNLFDPACNTKHTYMKHTYNDKMQQVKPLRRTSRNVTVIPKKDWVQVNKRANAAW